MKQSIAEAEIESLLNDTSTDRKHLQVGLENQKVTLPEPDNGTDYVTNSGCSSGFIASNHEIINSFQNLGML